MTEPTTHRAIRIGSLAELLGNGPAAVDEGAAWSWVQGVEGLDMPSAGAGPFAAEAMGVALEPGERYGVSRGVAVVPVRGILTPDSPMLERYLGWATYAGLTETAEALAANEDVAAVVLDINSPGGAVLAFEGAAEALKALAAVKPVIALCSPYAASAAYWLAVTAGEIVVTPGGWVGSIGIMVTGADPVQPGMSGFQSSVLRSRHAMGKAPDLTTEEGRALAQAMADNLEARFHAAVAAGRGIALDDLPGVLSADDNPRHGGGIFTPDAAMARGLVDRVQARSAFYDEVLGRYGFAPRQAPRSSSRSAMARARVAAAKSA